MNAVCLDRGHFTNMVRIINYIHYNVWDEITYSFPNFNGATVEVWEWMSNVIPHFIWVCDFISMLGFKLIHVDKKVRGVTRAILSGLLILMNSLTHCGLKNCCHFVISNPFSLMKIVVVWLKFQWYVILSIDNKSALIGSDLMLV